MPYLIWSEEHGAWWAKAKLGYTRSITDAGRYDQDEADRIVTDANRHVDHLRRFNELAIPDPFWPCEGDDL